MSYMVSLEAFHGPLDLLLFLIDKEQVDIYDIPIAGISDQFLDYLRQAGQYDLELIGDFLVMATYLLQLKSRLLLSAPARISEEDGQENINPGFELAEKLLAYKKIKAAAEFLAEKASGTSNRIFYRGGLIKPKPVVERMADLEKLLRAFQKLQKPWDDNNRENLLPLRDVDIEEKTALIMDCLSNNRNKIALQDLFIEAVSKKEALVVFLALLELIRQQKVKAIQEKVFGDIIIFV